MNITPEEEHKFAVERSHKASHTSNEHSRATAQACILINGGAATAVIAFLAKDNLQPAFLLTVPWCLVGYGVGVFFGALMMYCAMETMDYWNKYWFHKAHKSREFEISDAQANAEGWWFWFRWFFSLSVLSFLASSTALAYLLYSSKLAQLAS